MRRSIALLWVVAPLLLGGSVWAKKHPAADPPRSPAARPMMPQRPMSMTRGEIPLCARFLMNAHAAVLKSRLDLSDEQLTKVESIRTGFLTERVKVRSELEQNHIKMQELLHEAMPPEEKVIALEKKNVALRGQLAERGIRSYFGFLNVLSSAQRTELRAQCPKMARRMMRMGRMARYRRMGTMPWRAGKSGTASQMGR